MRRHAVLADELVTMREFSYRGEITISSAESSLKKVSACEHLAKDKGFLERNPPVAGSVNRSSL
jgi:hypothetical protein